MKTKFLYYIQKALGYCLDVAIIPGSKTTGYSLVKSQKANLYTEDNVNIAYPCELNNVKVGRYSYIAKNSIITNTEIKQFCSIGPNFCCGLGRHPINGISTAPMFYSTGKQNGVTFVTENKYKESLPIYIGNDVFIGANVTILDGVRIGDGAVIGAGAVVTKDIPDYAIAVGVPAKVKNFRFDENTIKRLKKIEWWNLNINELAEVEQMLFDVGGFTKKL